MSLAPVRAAVLMLAFLVAVAATAGAGPADRDMPGNVGQWCHGVWATGQC